MKIITLLFLLSLSFSSFAEIIICDKVESKGEGHWPLPEKAFTKKRYEKSIFNLNEISKVNAVGRDYINVENDLMYIKGYMLKIHNEKEEFCDFIKNEAYVRH